MKSKTSWWRSLFGRRQDTPVQRLTELLSTVPDQDNMDYSMIKASIAGLEAHEKQKEDKTSAASVRQEQENLRLALWNAKASPSLFVSAEQYVGALLTIRNFGPQFDGEEARSREQLEFAIDNVARELLDGKLYSCSMPEGFFLLLACSQRAADVFLDEMDSLVLFFQEQLEVELEAVVCDPLEGTHFGARACWWHCLQLLDVKKMIGTEQRLFTEENRMALSGSENVIPRYVNLIYSGTPTGADADALLAWCFTPDDSTLFGTRLDAINTLTLDAARVAGVAELRRWSVSLRETRDGVGYAKVLSGLWQAIALSREEQQRQTQDDISGKLKAYLQEHYADYDLSIGRAAAALNYNHSRMAHVFKEQTGQSPIEYLTRLRLQKAKESLIAGNSIRDAAEQCGFLDGRALGVVFKKVEGVSPSQWLSSQTKNL